MKRGALVPKPPAVKLRRFRARTGSDRRSTSGPHLRRSAGAIDFAQAAFDSRAQQLPVGIGLVWRGWRVRAQNLIQRGHELTGISVKMDRLVAQAFKFRNVRADNLSAGEPAFHQAAAESFAQGVNPDDPV